MGEGSFVGMGTATTRAERVGAPIEIIVVVVAVVVGDGVFIQKITQKGLGSRASLTLPLPPKPETRDPEAFIRISFNFL